MSRISQAFRAFFALLFGGKLPEDLVLELGLTRRIVNMSAPPPPPKAEPTASASDGAVQMLSVLQAESRIIDFFQEDISGYSDEEVGSAMRGVHEQCRKALGRVVELTPIIDGVEGAATTVAAAGSLASDRAAVKIVGNVPADGKVESGVLRHRGWRVTKVNLPALKAGKQLTIVAPAEIEVE